ncbi:ornithine decarboxylase, partial [Staphylococcus epidermidis]
IVPEKNDLNSILFLMTPAEDDAKMNNLISKLIQFEKYIDQDAPLEVVLPRLYNSNHERYKNYTIRELCQELHDFYKEHNTK